MENKYDILNQEGVPRWNFFIIDFLEKIEKPDKKLFFLELGCNDGYNLTKIQEIIPNSYTIGVDLLDEIKGEVDEYYTYNIEKGLPPAIEKYNFDYILLPDILEHLSNPKIVLENIKENLLPNGKILSTIPNLMHYTIIQDLLINGNFTYKTTGLLDSDHKHLFTFNEINNMFHNTGYKTTIYSMRLPEEEEKKIYNIEFMNKVYNITNLDRLMFETFEYAIEAWT